MVRNEHSVVLNDMNGFVCCGVFKFKCSVLFTNEGLIVPSPYTLFTQMQDDCKLQQPPRKYTTAKG